MGIKIVLFLQILMDFYIIWPNLRNDPTLSSASLDLITGLLNHDRGLSWVLRCGMFIAFLIFLLCLSVFKDIVCNNESCSFMYRTRVIGNILHVLLLKRHYHLTSLYHLYKRLNFSDLINLLIIFNDL